MRWDLLLLSVLVAGLGVCGFAHFKQRRHSAIKDILCACVP